MSKTVFPYPGGKARHADWILSFLPDHTCYAEPFGGSGAVLFAKEPSEVEVFNDRDGDIVQFFEVLRERPDDLQAWLEAVPFARDLYTEWSEAFYNGVRPDDPVKRAGRFFALRYMQFGGKYHGVSGFGGNPTRNGGRAMRNKVAELHTFADRLRHAYIESIDWSKVVERYDRPETVFYCDPPYVGTEGYYNEGVDHRDLCETLSTIDGYAIVSYDSVPEFYGDGWNVETKASTSHIDNVGGSGPKDTTEVLLMNYDPVETPTFRRGDQATVAEF